jgi:NitT/TauT family transport system ATP-binding protein
MDEPFAALDEMTQDRMNEELLRLQREHGWTVVFVTHSVTEAVFLSSRIVILAPHPGRIHDVVHVELKGHRTGDTRVSAKFEDEVSRVSGILRGAHSA